ncbi:hypothetical protein EYC84_004086 [Monilinia fructicola]|uniref:Uncharacterized protein n=1 Tax=Monilinia fructicola TaxID=38448 RepID=A0A5M9K497_MONFR|nr:hypothetical protein EYC84_004086 [Monilinia fructicola]
MSVETPQTILTITSTLPEPSNQATHPPNKQTNTPSNKPTQIPKQNPATKYPTLPPPHTAPNAAKFPPPQPRSANEATDDQGARPLQQQQQQPQQPPPSLDERVGGIPRVSYDGYEFRLPTAPGLPVRWV